MEPYTWEDRCIFTIEKEKSRCNSKDYYGKLEKWLSTTCSFFLWSSWSKNIDFGVHVIINSYFNFLGLLLQLEFKTWFIEMTNYINSKHSICLWPPDFRMTTSECPELQHFQQKATTESLFLTQLGGKYSKEKHPVPDNSPEKLCLAQRYVSLFRALELQHF